jgi:DNA mismatch endonuclease (patch repair protein)
LVDTVSKPARRRIMQSVRQKNTKQEKQVRSVIHRAGFRFSLHRSDLPGSPDIALVRYKVIVFVNGCFWHGHDCSRARLPTSNAQFWKDKIETNKRRDKRNVKALQDDGWHVHIIWQCRLKEDTDSALATLKQRRQEGKDLHQAP